MKKLILFPMLALLNACSQKEQCWDCTYSMDVRASFIIIYPDSTYKQSSNQVKCGMTEREKRRYERHNSMTLVSNGDTDAIFKMNCQ